MRAMIWVPIAVLLAAFGGVALTQLLGANLSTRELIAAGATEILAGELALLPLLLTRRASHYAVIQAALVSTIVHLFVSGIGAAIALLGKMVSGPPLVYWIFAFYCSTLIVVAMAAVKAIKAAPIASSPKA
jgi:hypothetical protein